MEMFRQIAAPLDIPTRMEATDTVPEVFNRGHADGVSSPETGYPSLQEYFCFVRCDSRMTSTTNLICVELVRTAPNYTL